MASGEVEVPRVAENEHAIAIRDINPRSPVHVLIIPKVHIPTAGEVDDEHASTLTEMFALAQEVARLEKVSGSGYRLAMNVGDDAGMTISHLHMHVLGGRSLGPEG